MAAGTLTASQWTNSQVAFDASGTLFIASLNNSRLAVLRSRNYDPTANGGFGTSFDVYKPFGNSGADKPVLTTGPDGNGGQAVYVTATSGTLLLTCAPDADDSNPANVHFTPAQQIGSSNAIAQTVSLAAQPDGDLVVLQSDELNLFSQIYSGTQLLNYETGDTPVAPTLSSTIAGPDGTAAFSADGIVYGDRLFIPASPNRGAVGLTFMDVNHTTGELWACYALEATPIHNQLGSDETAVYLTHSSNGASWSPPVRVDPSGGSQFGAIVAIDQPLPGETSPPAATGYVNVLYYTTDGNAISDQASIRPRLATFDPATGIWSYRDLTTVTSNASLPDNTRSGLDYGDYIGLAATGGRAVASWSSRDPIPGTSAGNFNLYAETATLGSTTPPSPYSISATTGDDAVTLALDSSQNLQVTVNGVMQTGVGSPYSLALSGLAGNDTLTIDETNGNPIPQGGLAFDGGTGTNDIFVTGRDSNNAASTNKMFDNSFVISGSNIVLDGGSISVANLSSLQIAGGKGSDSVMITSGISYSLTFNGVPSGSGANDLLTLDMGETGYAQSGQSITFNGGGATNVVCAYGTQDDDTATYDSSGLTFDGFMPTVGSGDYNIHLFTKGGNDLFTLNGVLPAGSEFNGTGNDMLTVNTIQTDFPSVKAGSLTLGLGVGSYDIGDLPGASGFLLNGASLTANSPNLTKLVVSGQFGQTGHATIDLNNESDGIAGATVLGQVVVNSGGVVNFKDTRSGVPDTCTITSLEVNGGKLNVTNGGNYTINSMTMTGGAVTLDGSANYAIGATGGVSISGGTLKFTGSGSYTVGDTTVDGGQLDASGDATVNMSSLIASDGGSFDLTNDSFSNIGAIQCLDSAPCSIGGASIYSVGGVDISGSELDLNAGSVTQLSDTTVEEEGLIELTGAACDLKGLLTIEGGSSVVLASSTDTVAGSMLVVAGLSIDSSSWLDVNNNSLGINYRFSDDPAGQVWSYLASGYSGGAWNGFGIRSGSAHADSSHATALGYWDDTDDGFITVTYALYGDADLSRTVDFNDFLAFQNHDTTNGLWAAGDFNYSGTVDFNDFLLLQANYNHTGP